MGDHLKVVFCLVCIFKSGWFADYVELYSTCRVEYWADPYAVLRSIYSGEECRPDSSKVMVRWRSLSNFPSVGPGNTKGEVSLYH
jgi:hypothetical protein